MGEKADNGSLERLRQYIAEETERLGQCGGQVHQIDLDEIDEDGASATPAPLIDPLKRDVDVLFGSLKKRRSADVDKHLS